MCLNAIEQGCAAHVCKRFS